MSDALADEPKEEKIGGIVYKERATIKQWDAHGKQFINPTGIWIDRQTRKDADKKTIPVFVVQGRSGNAFPLPGSVITDKDGNEFEVIQMSGAAYGFGQAVPIKQIKTAAGPKKP